MPPTSTLSPSAGTPPTELKIVLLGAGGVGKSALAMQFVQGHFPLAYDPTIEDSYRRALEVPSSWLGVGASSASTSLVLELMDTAGAEQFAGMRDLYVRRGDAFLLVYALDSQASLQAVQSIYEQIVRLRGPNVPMLLVGNKSDLSGQRQVSPAAANMLARQWKLSEPVETSARTGAGVSECFMQIVQLALFSLYGQAWDAATSQAGGGKGKKSKCHIM